MRIVRRGKDFIVTKGIKDIANFDNFDVARQFLADNGNKDATGKLAKFKTSTKRQEELYTAHIIHSVKRFRR